IIYTHVIFTYMTIFRSKKKVKNIIMISIKYILVFIILIGIYIITLTVSSIITSSALEKNVRESSETLNEEGERVFYNLGYKEERSEEHTSELQSRFDVV